MCARIHSRHDLDQKIKNKKFKSWAGPAQSSQRLMGCGPYGVKFMLGSIWAGPAGFL